MMKVNEIFLSIQGESLTAGYPTTFVRFTGCNLRCAYCDTSYAYYEGDDQTPEQVADKIAELGCGRVCLTGGEPLLQPEIGKLLEYIKDYSVSIETNGSVLLNRSILKGRHYFVMDMKTPSSGHAGDMLFDNFAALEELDEIKFVIGSREDYEWSRQIIREYYRKGAITFSPVFHTIEYRSIVEWILEDRLDVRFQLQLHKIIWNPEQRGV